MRTKNRPLTAGLAAFGLLWTSAHCADAQEAAPPSLPPAPLPAAATTAPTNVPAFAVLLLSNGRIVQGEISLDKTGENYLLHLKGGPVPMPKANVVKKFASMKELYEHKVASIAPRDVDELMRLVQWCLENRMNVEAKEHLKQVLAINPNDTRAERMISNIDASLARTAMAHDAEVKTTSVDVVEKAPRELSPAALARAKGEIGKAINQPVVFDLPPQVARKRLGEFATYVHPVLQTSCVSCHNQQYTGEFQLIAASRAEVTADVLRANLDATLRLVNRREPLKSELLTAATTPHGGAPKAAFFGPNDQKFRTVAFWLNNLRSGEPVNRASFAPPAAPMVTQSTPSGFGADRYAGRSSATPTGNSDVVPAPGTFGTPQPRISVTNLEGEAVAPGVPNGTRFDPPFVLGAENPVPIPPRKPRPLGPAVVNANPDIVPGLPLGQVQPAAVPGVMPALPPGAMPPLPPAQNPALANLPQGTPVPPPDDVIPPTNRARKKPILDPKLVEQVLKSKPQP